MSRLAQASRRQSRSLGRCLFGLALATLAAGYVQAQAVGNLVRNPGFAAGLEPWRVETWAGAETTRPAIDTAVFRGSDMASLRLPAESGRRTVIRQVGLPRDPAVNRYRFSLWTRTRDLAPGWTLRVGVERWQAGRYVTTMQNLQVPCTGSVAWTRTEIPFTPHEGTAEFGVYVGLWYPDTLAANPPAGGGTVWVEDVVLEPVVAASAAPAAEVPAKAPDLEVQSFHPLGEGGLFTPGQPLDLELVLLNRSTAAVDLAIDVGLVDLEGAAVSQVTVQATPLPGASCRVPVRLAAPVARGFFSARAELRQGGVLVAWPETGLCVVVPTPARDPFFGIDANGLTADLLEAYRLMGVGSLGFYQSWAVPAAAQADPLAYMREQVQSRWRPFWDSDFALVGYVKIDPGFHPAAIRAETAARREKGLFPYPDALYTTLAAGVQAEAEVMKDRVKTWIICEEIDAWVQNPSAPAGSGSCELARHVLMTRIAAAKLRQSIPDATIAALAVCMDYQTEPPYALVRRVLPEVKDCFDLIGVHPYCGGHSFAAGGVTPPETGRLRQVLLATRKLQAENGKSRTLIIPEKGLGVPYHQPLDHPQQRQQAVLTARNLVIAKSVYPCLFYSLHMGVANGMGREMKAGRRRSTEQSSYSDYGIWKQTADEKDVHRHHPRPAVAAYAVTARQLAGTMEAEEVLPRQGVYAYVFRCTAGAVAALWTTGTTPCPVHLNLPGPARLCDLMGNERELAAGDVELTLSDAPQFVRSAGTAAVLAEAVRRTAFPALPAVVGEAHLSACDTLSVYVLNLTSQPAEAEVEAEFPAALRAATRGGRARLEPSGRGRVDLHLEADAAALNAAGVATVRIRGPGQTALSRADLHVTTVARLQGPVTIDGDLAEAARLPRIVMDGPQYLQPAMAKMPESHLWNGTEDLAVSLALAWNEQGLYLAARVRDDVHLQRQSGSLIWMDDALQFAIDAANDALLPATCGQAGYDGNDLNAGMALTAAGPAFQVWVEKGSTKTAGGRDYPLAIRRQGTETTYEAILPWPALAPLEPRTGRAFGFSLLAFDNDRSEDRQAACRMELTPGIADGQDPSAYRTFVLGE